VINEIAVQRCATRQNLGLTYRLKLKKNLPCTFSFCSLIIRQNDFTIHWHHQSWLLSPVSWHERAKCCILEKLQLSIGWRSTLTTLFLIFQQHYIHRKVSINIMIIFLLLKTKFKYTLLSPTQIAHQWLRVHKIMWRIFN